MEIFLGGFVLVHGLVHLLYFGQSWRLFELQPGLTWPDGSWVLSRYVGGALTRRVAGAACGVIAAAFVMGGAALLAGLPFARPLIAGAAVGSAAAFVVFWDGKPQHLDGQGGVGVLIDIALLAVLLAV